MGDSEIRKVDRTELIASSARYVYDAINGLPTAVFNGSEAPEVLLGSPTSGSLPSVELEDEDGVYDHVEPSGWTIQQDSRFE